MSKKDNKWDLSRRSVLGGIATVGAAGAVAGSGTFALFSDQESSDGNTIQAGTLNLANGNGEDNITATLNADNGGSGIKPGMSGQHVVGMQNTGSIAGTLDITVDNLNITQPDNPTADLDPEIPIDLDDIGQDQPEDPPSDSRYFTLTHAAPGFGDLGPGGNRVGLLDDIGFNLPVYLAYDWKGGAGYYSNYDDFWIVYPNSDDSFNNFSLVIDSDNSGTADIHVGYQPSGSNTDNGWFYKTEENGYWSDRIAGTPSEVHEAKVLPTDASGVQAAAIALTDGTVADPFAVGGHLAYNNPLGSSYNHLAVPLTPGFDWWQDDGGALATSSNYTTVRHGSGAPYRNLADVIDVDMAIYDDYSAGTGKTDLGRGKLSNVLDPEAKLTDYTFQNEPDEFVVDWSLSINASNPIQGETVTFDVTAELTQQ